MDLTSVVRFLDERIDIHSVADAAVNGLQVDAGSDVSRVGLAVDGAAATIDAAIEGGCQLLVVHHGLFWGSGPLALTGAHGARVRRCFEAGLSIYAAHLPLDLHPQLGNNALLAHALGGEVAATFGAVEGVDIGAMARFDPPVSLAELAGRLAGAGCDEQLMWSFGPDPIEHLAVVTGSGCSFMGEAVAAGADCFLTGEPRQSAYHDAREARLSCLFAGHYATEVFGVRAVGDLLRTELELETLWLDHPTGV